MLDHNIVHHCVVSGLGLNNSLNNTSTYLTNSNVVLAIMNSIVIVAVNVYFLISGYFGIHFKWKKMLKLLGVIIFYSTCVYGVCVVLGLEELSIKKTISYSVLSVRYYWFMIVYMVLMLLSDYINIVLDKVLSEKKYI